MGFVALRGFKEWRQKHTKEQGRLWFCFNFDPEYPVTSDICATLISAVVARGTLAVWELTAKYDVFDSKWSLFRRDELREELVQLEGWVAFLGGHRLSSIIIIQRQKEALLKKI